MINMVKGMGKEIYMLAVVEGHIFFPLLKGYCSHNCSFFLSFPLNLLTVCSEAASYQLYVFGAEDCILSLPLM